MKNRKFLNYGGRTAVSALLEGSRQHAAKLREQGFRPDPGNQFNLLNSDDGPELIIYGTITPFAFWEDEVNAAQVIDQLREINGQDLTVRINSPGGSVREGVAIFNLLKNHKGKVTTIVDGMAGSIASVIFMAGDVRQVGEGAMVMIHNAMSGIIGYADDLRAEADVLDKITGQIRDIYAKRVNLSADEIAEAMTDETFYTEAEAVEAGFADEVVNLDPAPPAAPPADPENRAPEPPEDPPVPEPENTPTPDPDPVPTCKIEDIAAIRARTAQLAERFGLDLQKLD